MARRWWSSCRTCRPCSQIVAAGLASRLLQPRMGATVKLSLQPADASPSRAHLLAVGVLEGGGVSAPTIDKALRRKLESLRAGADFAGKPGKSVAVAAPAGFGKIVLFVGLGKNRDAHEMARRLGGIALGKCSDLGATRLVIAPPAADEDTAFAVAEGVLLADYTFDRHKSTAKAKKGAPKKDVLAAIAVTDGQRASVRSSMKLLEGLAAGVKLARDLGNEPSNILTATRLAEEAEALAKSRKADGITCRVLGLKEIEKLGMGSF